MAANGFRYRIPTATLLAVSDKPLHAQPKLSADAQSFYAASRRQHVEIAISVAEKVRQLYPGGLPTADLRSPDEPLLGITDPEPARPRPWATWSSSPGASPAHSFLVHQAQLDQAEFMTNAIEVRALRKSFGPTRALDGLDLTVRTGEVHAFLGPNGAGKTTTIRILLGLLRKDGGEVSLLGGDPWRDAVRLHARLAYVPGDVTLWPALTGGEIIDLLARLRGRQSSSTPSARTR